ncbi:MAG: 3-hydroxyacyl-[acyl-carrier-protein] dehydratase FabZ [Nitrospiraceae bacterium]|nr:3-hydroxyacyl-[acyl-carrier-protein] dehydratase FabZ [Nitrospiraceae bacterium]|tara:strand:+ start:1664 stop:2176 length:513 start_codon:yes stop_codon:yes gene_type:complete
MGDHHQSQSVDICEILRILPHRYPFLLVDRILELELGERIVGVKNVTINEPFFPGHFPDRPIMPGVLLIEALAQISAVLAYKSSDGHDGNLVYFMGIDQAKFRKPVVPGDQLRMEVKVLRKRTPYWKTKGWVYVESKVVCEAELLAMFAGEKDAVSSVSTTAAIIDGAGS